MKKLMMTACALALSSLALAQMTDSADARSRHGKGMSAKSATSKTGGRMSSPSAAGGNSASPSQPGARGSGGASGSN